MALTETREKVITFRKDPETGESLENEAPIVSEQYERTADNPRDVKALLGEMKDWGQISLQQAWNRERKYGTEDLSNGVGNPVRVLGNQVERYRASGYGQKALKATFAVNGFGGMKRDGLRKAKYVYRGGVRETVYEQ